jgi:hypothetical protein
MSAAVSTVPVKELFDNFGQDATFQAAEEMMKMKGSSIFVIVAISRTVNEEWSKGLLIYRPKEHSQALVETFDELTELLAAH